MNNDYKDDYQYDSCVSRGICSINPRTSSLLEVLVIYLKITAYYALKLHDYDTINVSAKNIILNTISIIVSNPEFSETDFLAVTEKFNSILPEIIDEYETLCKQNNIEPKYIHAGLQFSKKVDIIESIQFGEKEFLIKVQQIPTEIRNIYGLLFVLAKSLCINILDLESFGIDSANGYLTILKLLNSLDTKNLEKEKLKNMLIEVAKEDSKLMFLLRTTQEKRYGTQRKNNVSYSTVPGKAVLVVGSNLKELEDILEALKEEKIDIYTHDEMMLAYTFPKFSEYKNLKGQFGQGMENCLLDFATFPGPIILTRHSLYNVEHLYRGLLFTTDFACSKGIISIKNNNFSDLIKSALNSKGFKTGRQCESVNIGFDYNNLMEIIDKKFRNFSKIFIVGLSGYTLEQQTYFNKLLKQTPDDVLIISLSYCREKENIICLNACFDSYAIVKITEKISSKYDLPITLFIPKCDRYTISQLIYLKNELNIEIYLGKCTPIVLNPSIINTFNELFSINRLSSVRKDLTKILEKK